MPNWIVADDLSSSIAYAGAWSALRGSSRQWAEGVHTTTQSGATARFRWRGTGIQVWGTIPSGSGTARSTYSIDGGSAVTVDRQARSADEYGNLFFERRGLNPGEHTITITNVGSSVALQLDKLEWYPLDNDLSSEQPMPPPPPLAAPNPPTTPRTPAPPTTNQPTPTPDVPNTPVNQPNENQKTDSPGNTSNNSPGTTPGQSQSTPPTSTSISSTSSVSTSSRTFQGSIPTGLSDGAHTITGTGGAGSETLILNVQHGVTHTVTEEGPGSTGGVVAVGATKTGISKGALGGIIAASIAVMFIFLFLAILLMRKYRKRRAALLAGELADADARSTASDPQTTERRNQTLYPFDMATQRASAMIARIGRPVSSDPNRAPFTRLRDSIHKPPLEPVGTARNGPSYSPSESSSRSTYSYNTSTLLPSDAGYLRQDAMESAPGPSTLHRRRNTSDIVGFSGDWPESDVPPPSYQASNDGSHDSTAGGSSFVTAPVHRAI